MHIAPVILCGGSGTRLWPLSREGHPKQFIDMGNGRSLFRDTLRRAIAAPRTTRPLIVCNEAYRFYVAAELLQESAEADILLEPAGRNTAPALALAAFALTARGDDPLLCVMPSDHAVGDAGLFYTALQRAAVLAEQGRIVAFGVLPTTPETGFGYLEQGEPLGQEGFSVIRFVEKPSLEKAAAMLARGGYYWNSGMFLLRASTYLAELERLSPTIFTACRNAWEGHQQDGAFYRPEVAAFLASPSDSVDYAVMEHTNLVAMIPLETSWSDLGSWEAFYQEGQKDEEGNVRQGDIIAVDTKDCYLSARHRLLAAVDLHDMLVVETQDAVLVASRKHAQDVKRIVGRLRLEERREYREHPLVQRPWGSYETLALDTRFQVKRIIVNPGAELSLQMHHHRAEHWVVVSGTAEVTNGDEVRLFTEDQSTYIPVGGRHRLKNPGVIPLVLIEIQSGSYLGEDDIIRFEDVYGRNEQQAADAKETLQAVSKGAATLTQACSPHVGG